MLSLLLSQIKFTYAGGSASSSSDQWLFWIPLFLLLYIWLAPKVYYYLKEKFKKQEAEEEKQE